MGNKKRPSRNQKPKPIDLKNVDPAIALAILKLKEIMQRSRAADKEWREMMREMKKTEQDFYDGKHYEKAEKIK